MVTRRCSERIVADEPFDILVNVRFWYKVLATGRGKEKKVVKLSMP